jgi:hypothetical protein
MKDRTIATEQYNVDLCNKDQIIATKHTLWIYVSVQNVSPKGTKAGWYMRNSGCSKNGDATCAQGLQPNPSICTIHPHVNNGFGVERRRIRWITGQYGKPLTNAGLPTDNDDGYQGTQYNLMNANRFVDVEHLSEFVSHRTLMYSRETNNEKSCQ